MERPATDLLAFGTAVAVPRRGALQSPSRLARAPKPGPGGTGPLLLTPLELLDRLAELVPSPRIHRSSLLRCAGAALTSALGRHRPRAVDSYPLLSTALRDVGFTIPAGAAVRRGDVETALELMDGALDLDPRREWVEEMHGWRKRVGRATVPMPTQD